MGRRRALLVTSDIIYYILSKYIDECRMHNLQIFTHLTYTVSPQPRGRWLPQSSPARATAITGTSRLTKARVVRGRGRICVLEPALASEEAGRGADEVFERRPRARNHDKESQADVAVAPRAAARRERRPQVCSHREQEDVGQEVGEGGHAHGTDERLQREDGITLAREQQLCHEDL